LTGRSPTALPGLNLKRFMIHLRHETAAATPATACRAFGREITLHEALNLTSDRGDRIGERPSRVPYFLYKSSHFMTKVEAARFLREAEERLQQTVKSVNPLDQQSWLRVAKEWVELAKGAERRRLLF
jgi:hypothetical protein